MTIEERELDFRSKVNLMIAFPFEIRAEFIDYWTEPSKSGTKMRFELEKTWDLKRRLLRWANNPVGGNIGPMKIGAVKSPQKSVKQDPTNEVERLDQFLEKYISRPGDIPLEAFGRWYDYMKAERLLIIGREKGQELMEIYKGNKDKCRCACVQMTMDGYVKGGITFCKVMEVRKQLA